MPAATCVRSVSEMTNNSPSQPTNAFVGASWAALLAGTVAYIVGLWNAELLPSEKGFYAMSFTLSLFSAVTVQKNVRDLMPGAPDRDKAHEPSSG
jgi:uncharacterized membrane protein YiaA